MPHFALNTGELVKRAKFGKGCDDPKIDPSGQLCDKWIFKKPLEA
jgi:hypothetical protein